MKICCAGGVRACVRVWDDEGVCGYECKDMNGSMKVKDENLLCWWDECSTCEGVGR